MLDEVSGWTVGGWGVGNCIKYLKRRWDEKRGGETDILKGGGMLGKGVGALKVGAMIPLRTMLMGFLGLNSFYVLVILQKLDNITRQIVDEIARTKKTNF